VLLLNFELNLSINSKWQFLGCATTAFTERFMHLTPPFGRSCIRNSCTPLFRKRVGHWAQGLPLATALKSVMSQRLCWVSLHPAVLYCTEMRLPLIERVLSTTTRVGSLIVATIYLQLIQNRYMFRSVTLLQCSRQHCLQPVASDVEVVGYL